MSLRRSINLRVTLHCSLLALAACVAACDAGDADADAPGCDGQAGATDGGGDDTAVPIAVDCSFSFDGVQTDVTYLVAEERTETAVGGKLIASGMLSDPEFDTRSFTMTIYAEDSSVLATTLYQMDRTRLPSNEFYGDHGFTGLNGVKDPEADENVQYACFARDPGAPMHVWEN